MWTPDDSLRTALHFCVWYCFNLALCCQRHHSSKWRWASRCVFPVHQPPACLRFPSSEVFGLLMAAHGFRPGLCVFTSICLRLVLVIPRSSVEPARHSRLHTHSSSCFSRYYCSWYPALLIFCNLVLIFTLFFTIAFCQSILQKMCFRNWNVFCHIFCFFTFLFLFNTDIYCLFYSLR